MCCSSLKQKKKALDPLHGQSDGWVGCLLERENGNKKAEVLKPSGLDCSTKVGGEGK
ncbi:hypothetical protein GCM10008938_06410 [Deinococcus roseus]|uniref:Uncharacterized protein n=1 Tax=Deinococcus roseus TaxID=392414 RepID=A0ABQ2CW79_9DEIO|nr:hypothetical protein GCM10008938_06410 [Deinococcus roseus]